MLSSKKKFFFTYWTAYLVFISFYMYQTKREEYKNSEKITATVIDRIESTERRKHYFYPQFQFGYNDSIYISADQLYWTREKRKGEMITVIFPKGDPEDAVVYTFVSWWIPLPPLLISFMIFFFFFAVIVFFKWKDDWTYFR
jgi:hypothetical protein